MEQQQQDQLQLLRAASTQLAAGESDTPDTGQVERSSSTPPQYTGLMPLPAVSTVPPARAGTPQVFFNNNTQDSGAQMSGPLSTEDRYSTSSGSDQ